MLRQTQVSNVQTNVVNRTQDWDPELNRNELKLHLFFLINFIYLFIFLIKGKKESLLNENILLTYLYIYGKNLELSLFMGYYVFMLLVRHA